MGNISSGPLVLPPHDFPWSEVQASAGVGLGGTNKLVAGRIEVGMGSVGTAVCKRLSIGMGHAHKAIVFESVQIGMGSVSELHTVSGIHLSLGLGSVGKHFTHPLEVLVQMARKEAGLPPSSHPVYGPHAGVPVATSHTTTTTTMAPQPFLQFNPPRMYPAHAAASSSQSSSIKGVVAGSGPGVGAGTAASTQPPQPTQSQPAYASYPQYVPAPYPYPYTNLVQGAAAPHQEAPPPYEPSVSANNSNAPAKR